MKKDCISSREEEVFESPSSLSQESLPCPRHPESVQLNCQEQKKICLKLQNFKSWNIDQADYDHIHTITSEVEIGLDSCEDESIKNVSTTLASLSNLKCLNFSLHSGRVSYRCLTYLGSALSRLSNLAKLTLNLRSTQLKKKEFTIIEQSLALMPNLIYLNLNLSDNQISEEGSISLCDSLSCMSRLTKLDLDLHGNQLGSKGVEQIVQSLTKLDNLIDLSFRCEHVNLCDEEQVRLKKQLKQFTRLQRLKVLLQNMNIMSVDEANLSFSKVEPLFDQPKLDNEVGEKKEKKQDNSQGHGKMSDQVASILKAQDELKQDLIDQGRRQQENQSSSEVQNIVEGLSNISLKSTAEEIDSLLEPESITESTLYFPPIRFLDHKAMLNSIKRKINQKEKETLLDSILINANLILNFLRTKRMINPTPIYERFSKIQGHYSEQNNDKLVMFKITFEDGKSQNLALNVCSPLTDLPFQWETVTEIEYLGPEEMTHKKVLVFEPETAPRRKIFILKANFKTSLSQVPSKDTVGYNNYYRILQADICQIRNYIQNLDEQKYDEAANFHVDFFNQVNQICGQPVTTVSVYSRTLQNEYNAKPFDAKIYIQLNKKFQIKEGHTKVLNTQQDTVNQVTFETYNQSHEGYQIFSNCSQLECRFTTDIEINNFGEKTFSNDISIKYTENPENPGGVIDLENVNFYLIRRKQSNLFSDGYYQKE